MTDNYKKNREKLRKEARERYQTFNEKEKEKIVIRTFLRNKKKN